MLSAFCRVSLIIQVKFDFKVKCFKLAQFTISFVSKG